MFRIKQYIKMLLQNVLLPVIYFCFCHAPVRKGSVIFADAHHSEMPFSMRRMYETLLACNETGRQQIKQGRSEETADGPYQIELFIADFGTLSFGAMVKFLLRFMKQYATAEYVFICDYFLPVASCKKRPQTKVVQLWHSCGLMKKIAFDAKEDIPKNYKGNMFGNYSYLTMSADICVPVHARALQLPLERIHATGISRTDYYFDAAWNEKCRDRFYREHPQAKGKKVALWAPTFRGNAAMPYLEGLAQIQGAAEELRNEWYFVIKAHPHVDAHGRVSNCDIPTEELYAVADVLITDYSSVLFDYLIYQKPAVLFAPDLAQYETNRGFYLDYDAVPYPHTTTQEALVKALRTAEVWEKEHKEEIRQFREVYTGACDGGSTKRILKLIGMKK